jgi:hypothetical protein
MTDSGDGLYMFIGHTRGIVVIDANTQERVTAWGEKISCKSIYFEKLYFY